MATTETSTARDQVDRALAVVRRAQRFWRLSAVVSGVGCVVALLVAVLRPRVYKSETLMLYRDTLSSSELGVGENGADPGRKLGLKLKEMVLSRTRLQQIIDEYKLYPKLVEDQGYVEAVDEMRNHISFRVRDGDTFGLGFEGNNPERVQAITARLAATLIQENSRHRAEQAEGTREFLDAEMKRSEEALGERETSLARFLSKHPEFDSEQQTGSNGLRIPKAGSGAQPKSTDPQLMALIRDAQKVQEKLGMPVAAATSKPGKDVDPQLLAAKTDAEAEVRAAQHELSDKLSQFTEQHPDVRAAKAKLLGAESKLRHANEAIAQSSSAVEPAPVAVASDSDRPALEAQLQKINEQITAYRQKMRRDGAGHGEPAAPEGSGWIVALETDWSRLNREVNEARQQTQLLQERQFRASLVENAATSTRGEQMVIIDPAFKPTQPQKPGRTQLAGMGMAIAILAGLLVALGAALLDDRAYDGSDLERLALGPVLGVVPHAGRAQKGERVLG